MSIFAPIPSEWIGKTVHYEIDSRRESQTGHRFNGRPVVRINIQNARQFAGQSLIVSLNPPTDT